MAAALDTFPCGSCLHHTRACVAIHPAVREKISRHLADVHLAAGRGVRLRGRLPAGSRGRIRARHAFADQSATIAPGFKLVDGGAQVRSVALRCHVPDAPAADSCVYVLNDRRSPCVPSAYDPGAGRKMREAASHVPTLAQLL